MNRMNLLANRYLIRTYAYRFKAAGIVLEEDELVKKLENLDETALKNTLGKILSKDKNQILESIKALNIQAYIVNKDDSIDKLKEDAKKKLNLSDISEFQNGNKKYFKFTDRNGDIAVTKNLDSNARDLFLDILSSDTFVDKNDGKSNAEDIFKVLKKRKLIEVKLNSSTNIENEKSKRTKAIIKEFQKHFPNKKIEYSIEEQLFIVRDEKEDKILAIDNVNGKLKIKQLTQNKYENNDKGEKEQTAAPINEQEIIIEIENDSEINNIINNGIDNDVSDEIITSQVQNVINRKYSRFASYAGMALIISNLINNARNNGHNNSNNLSRGKAYVLTNGRNIFTPSDEVPQTA